MRIAFLIIVLIPMTFLFYMASREPFSYEVVGYMGMVGVAIAFILRAMVLTILDKGDSE
jgi:hypothetical protein